MILSVNINPIYDTFHSLWFWVFLDTEINLDVGRLDYYLTQKFFDLGDSHTCIFYCHYGTFDANRFTFDSTIQMQMAR